MYRLYHHPLNGFCRKLRLLLAEKNIPCELVSEKPWEQRPEFAALGRWLDPQKHQLLHFVSREQGIIVRPGVRVRGVGDLARPGLRFLNRPPGVGPNDNVDLAVAAAVAEDRATVRVETTVANAGGDSAGITVAHTIRRDGHVVAQLPPQSLPVPAGEAARFEQSVDLPQPALWSPDAPALYTVETSVSAADRKSVV